MALSVASQYAPHHPHAPTPPTSHIDLLVCGLTFTLTNHPPSPPQRPTHTTNESHWLVGGYSSPATRVTAPPRHLYAPTPPTTCLPSRWCVLNFTLTSHPPSPPQRPTHATNESRRLVGECFFSCHLRHGSPCHLHAPSATHTTNESY
jgi:hypothetical protein